MSQVCAPVLGDAPLQIVGDACVESLRWTTHDVHVVRAPVMHPSSCLIGDGEERDSSRAAANTRGNDRGGIPFANYTMQSYLQTPY
jgi:hypothetical protein